LVEPDLVLYPQTCIISGQDQLNIRSFITVRRKQTALQQFKQVVLPIIILPLVLPLAVFAFATYFLYRSLLYSLVWALWLPRGKDVLLVYSDSPIWQEYVTTQVLPLVQDRAVVLNWSRRKTWPHWSLAVAVFRHFGRDRDFNPLVILFKPLRSAMIFRYWSAFKDWNRGYKEHVEQITQDLFSYL